jgi:hypothetical protein
MYNVLVIDPVTDATETAESCRIEFGGLAQRVFGSAVRALYDAPSAKPYSDGSYTVSYADAMRALAGGTKENRLIATWNTDQDPAKDAPIRVRWAADDSPATLEDFARIDGNTQSMPDIDGQTVEFSYAVEVR